MTQKTVWMRRYQVDPNLCEEFIDFLNTKVFPARIEFGFTPEQVWVTPDQTQVTWFVSAPMDSESFQRLEAAWETSEERASVFAGTPQYVLDKDLREVKDVLAR